MTPVASDTKIETYIKCKKCSTDVFTIIDGGLTPCKWRAIKVDGFKDLVRVVTKPEDYKGIQK